MRIESEMQIHTAIIDWLKGSKPHWIGALPPGCEVHHSPNGGARLAFRMRQIRMGMCPGWPDVELFIHPKHWVHKDRWAPIFLEIKSSRGRLSPEQKLVMARLTRIGCYTHMVRSIDQAREALVTYVSLRDGF